MRPLIASCALLLSSCAANTVGTVSGRPEMTYRGTTMDAVLNELVIEFSSGGYYVAHETGHSVLFSKQVRDHPGDALALAGPPAATLWRVRCTTAERRGTVWVAVNVEIVSDPGGGRERTVDASRNTKIANDVQGILERIAVRLRRWDASDTSGSVPTSPPSRK